LQAQNGGDDTVMDRLMAGGGPFVLIVSALYPYKNHERLIEAFARIHQEFPEHRLAIVGADTPTLAGSDLRAMGERLGLGAKVITLGRISSPDLASLYRRADVMAMPSIDETFGLTVLEAMHFGCPVITSNISSMAEVGGTAAMLVNPLSVDEIAAALRRVLGSTATRAAMTDAGLKQAALFSKDRMIEKTTAAIAAAVNRTASLPSYAARKA
jgi:glycosyltransferase involved in cell wall biosynthesis